MFRSRLFLDLFCFWANEWESICTTPFFFKKGGGGPKGESCPKLMCVNGPMPPHPFSLFYLSKRKGSLFSFLLSYSTCYFIERQNPTSNSIMVVVYLVDSFLSFCPHFDAILFIFCKRWGRLIFMFDVVRVSCTP
mgnify:CR=1 FL=1